MTFVDLTNGLCLTRCDVTCANSQHCRSQVYSSAVPLWLVDGVWLKRERDTEHWRKKIEMEIPEREGRVGQPVEKFEMDAMKTVKILLKHSCRASRWMLREMEKLEN